MGMEALEPSEVASCPGWKVGLQASGWELSPRQLSPSGGHRRKRPSESICSKKQWKRMKEEHTLLSWSLFPSRNLPKIQVLNGKNECHFCSIIFQKFHGLKMSCVKLWPDAARVPCAFPRSPITHPPSHQKKDLMAEVGS